MPDSLPPLQTPSLAAPIPRSALLFDAAWFLFWAVVSSLWCVTAASQLGATFDEPIYVQRGLERWHTGSTQGLMKLGTMPLPVDVETLPLYLWETWHGVRLDPLNHLDKLLPWARASALVFWWLLLFYAWRAAYSLGGSWAGRLAVALLACEPSFLANAALATTDVAVSACLLALVVHFRAGRDGQWLRRVGWPALWFAAAVLAKASGLVFGGLCLIVIEAERRLAPLWDGDARVRGKDLWAALWRAPARGTFRGDLTQIVFLGMALVFVYCGCDWQPQASGLAWARSLPQGPGATAMAWLFEHARVFSNAGEGIAHQVTHSIRGHGVYILGQTDARSLWYYFPAVLSIKLTEPLLLAPLLLLAVRARALCNWAVLCAAAMLLFSLNAKVQIGVRLVLPLVALGVVGMAAAAVNAVRSFGFGWRGRAVVAGCAAAILWSATASWSVWPNGLCYVNRFWGNPANGDRLVSDANWDWGQGLKELARWQRRQGSEALDVWYFGADPALSRLPMRPLRLQDLPLEKPEDVAPYVNGRRVAVSTTLVHGCLISAAAPPAARIAQVFLATHRPVARTSTFLIYDFTIPGEPGRVSARSFGAIAETNSGR
jgi:hypothetical protein